MATIYLETTDVSDTKTVFEIQELLIKKGATGIAIEYDEGRVSSVIFRLKIKDGPLAFRLPCRWKSVERVLKSIGTKIKKADTLENKARRVAWRQILRWVQAQFALIETEMVKTEEVFLPYAIVINQQGKEQSYFEMTEEHKLLLPAPKEDNDSE